MSLSAFGARLLLATSEIEASDGRRANTMDGGDLSSGISVLNDCAGRGAVMPLHGGTARLVCTGVFAGNGSDWGGSA